MVYTMKRNKNSFPIAALSKLAILVCVAIIQLTISSEIQASGKIVIRKTPSIDFSVQAPNEPGFDSQWSFPNEQKQPVRIRFASPQVRQGVNKAVPKNPVEVTSPNDKAPHYVGSVEISKDVFLINTEKTAGNKVSVMLPELKEYFSRSFPREVFLNGEARRIVVWNGKEDEDGEQLLICNDELRSATGQTEAVLSIMPLPGKPLQIKRASDSFLALHNNLVRKIETKKDDKYYPQYYVWNGRISPYCAQSFEIHSVSEFIAKANAMIFSLYGDSAQLQIRPNQYAAIELLLANKYTWFSFEISMLHDNATFTEPIAYLTKSKSVCVPLHAGKIGGADEDTVTKVIVITPKRAIKLIDGLSKDDLIYFGNQSVEYSVNDLLQLSPEVAEFCKKHNMEKVFIRQFNIENRITQYPGDFRMIQKNEPEPNESSETTEPAPADNNANNNNEDSKTTEKTEKAETNVQEEQENTQQEQKKTQENAQEKAKKQSVRKK